MFKIIIRELKDHKWSLLAYCLGSILMLWLYVATFQSSQNSTAQLKELVKTYPKALLEVVGLNDLNMNTIERYLNAKHFSLIWPILAIILSISRAGNQIAGEVQTGTMGILLSLPVNRVKIFISKYISGFITIFTFCFVSLFAVVPIAAAYGFQTHPFILFKTLILTTLFMLSIYSFAIFISSLTSEKSKVYSVSAGVIFAQYMLYIISVISDKFAPAKYYSIFHYFNTAESLGTGRISVNSYLVFISIIVVFGALALLNFNKRDIRV